jgi:hypothetical protein
VALKQKMSISKLKVGNVEKFSFGFNVFSRDTDKTPLASGWGVPLSIEIVESGAAALTAAAGVVSAVMLF